MNAPFQLRNQPPLPPPHVSRFSLLIFGFLPLALLLPACCTPPLPPPPPISMSRQVGALNERAGLVTGLRAPGGHVWVQFKNDAGETESHQTDGVLLFRQIPTPAGAQPADVLLVGRFAGQDVFELGSNQTDHWMIIRLDVKKAYVGKIGGPGQSTMPLMAADVAKVLAIARLYEMFGSGLGESADGAGGGVQRIAMTVEDQPEPPTNAIYVVRTPSDRPAWIERIELVNRRTGNVDQVRMYHPDGTLEASATLADYRPADNAPASSTANDTDPGVTKWVPTTRSLALPHRIHIDYPDRGAKIELTFDDMSLAPELLGAPGRRAFATPDFSGLIKIDVDAPHPAPIPAGPR